MSSWLAEGLGPGVGPKPSSCARAAWAWPRAPSRWARRILPQACSASPGACSLPSRAEPPAGQQPSGGLAGRRRRGHQGLQATQPLTHAFLHFGRRHGCHAIAFDFHLEGGKGRLVLFRGLGLVGAPGAVGHSDEHQGRDSDEDGFSNPPSSSSPLPSLVWKWARRLRGFWTWISRFLGIWAMTNFSDGASLKPLRMHQSTRFRHLKMRSRLIS